MNTRNEKQVYLFLKSKRHPIIFSSLPFFFLHSGWRGIFIIRSGSSTEFFKIIFYNIYWLIIFFTCISSFNTSNNLAGGKASNYSLFTGKETGSGKLNTLTKFTQLENGTNEIQTHVQFQGHSLPLTRLVPKPRPTQYSGTKIFSKL